MLWNRYPSFVKEIRVFEQQLPQAEVDGTYSGTSFAMTFVAEDGARPSPNPTCQ